MNGVKFGDKHSFDDWDLILTKKSIGLPQPKTNYVDIEGSDGSLDLTEVLSGETKFKNRDLNFEFALQDNYEDFNEKLSEIANAIHGKKLKIILDEDDSYYYYGRVMINQFGTDKRIGKIVIYCDCEPYKYTLYETVVNCSGNGTITIYGERKTECPTLEVSQPVELTVNSITYKFDKAGTYQIPDIVIRQGYNNLKFSGGGTVRISYRNGVL